jgi:GT2 family glycosyltransferase
VRKNQAVSSPEIAVIVPSHFRPLRLRWLLNALSEQTLERSAWEVVVGHDSGAETEALLSSHPLALDGVLRHAAQPEGTGIPASNRNIALALVRAEAVVFTDDDCNPPPEWLARVRDAVARNPGAIIQGPVHADPDEQAMLRSPYPRTQHFDDVPRPWAETANIVYPRALLEQLGGFREGWLVGEDTDLLLRALATGASYVGDAAMATNHAIEEGTLLDWIRGAGRWRDLPELAALHPEFRELLFARVFWKDAHAWLLLAAGGVLATRRRPIAAALVLPYMAARPWRGGGVRGRLRHLLELPGWALIDLAEIAVLARASIRVGTPVL